MLLNERLNLTRPVDVLSWAADWTHCYGPTASLGYGGRWVGASRVKLIGAGSAADGRITHV